MTTRPRYTTAQLARFITLARGGRDRRTAALTAALDLTNPRTTLALLDDDEKGVTTADTLGGPQEMTVVTEAGKARTVAPSAHAAAGMSTRAIASVVGVSQPQVVADKRAGDQRLITSPAPAEPAALPESPAVVGLDGKTRTHQPPLLNADGTPATPLPTTTPEDNT